MRCPRVCFSVNLDSKWYTKETISRTCDSPMNETMTLAPAAGAGIGKILADRLLAEPGFVDAMIAAVMGGLRATRSFWAKDANGKPTLTTEADSKVQLQAFSMVMAHMEGEPIKRVIHQHLGAAGIDPTAALQESPALLAAVEREVQKAKWRHSGTQAHKRPQKKVEASETVVE